MAQCDGAALPFADTSFDLVVTAYGVMPFVADSAGVMREVARVLRPGGRFVFSTTHPMRWAFPDDPAWCCSTSWNRSGRRGTTRSGVAGHRSAER